MSNLVIDVEGLSKSFGAKKVVDNVSIQVERGQIYGFLGPNGSGKTTTIRMLCGLLKPDAGRGTCLGHDIVKESRAIKTQVGYMTQRFSLYEDLSIQENLDFVARLYQMPDRVATVQEALRRLGLTHRRTELAGSLSGGWKQRLALAACILHEPQLLLLDEPTAGVDPKARREFWDEIHDLAAQGLTVLVSTHYMDEAERCHRIAYIAYGKLLARGTAAEMIDQAGLVTVEITGSGLEKIAGSLRGASGVDMVAPFGTALHVSGSDGEALDRALAPYRSQPGIALNRMEPTLEDVFIHLMRHASDHGLNGGVQ